MMDKLIKRLDELNFVIGLYFGFVSLILWLGYFTSDNMHRPLVLWTALTFLVFSLFMIWVKGKID